MPRHKIFTARVIQQIQGLIDEGLNVSQIASAIGCTVGTLRVKCSQMQISLREKRKSSHVLTRSDSKIAFHPHIAQKETLSNRRANGKGKASLSLILPLEIIEQIHQRAALRGISDATLAATLLEIIARDDLYSAVLDEANSNEQARIGKASTQ